MAKVGTYFSKEVYDMLRDPKARFLFGSGGGGGGFITSLTTTGTSGAATVTGGVLNIPTYAAGVTDVTAANTTLTVSPTTGSVIVGLNLASANTWTANQAINGLLTLTSNGNLTMKAVSAPNALMGLSLVENTGTFERAAFKWNPTGGNVIVGATGTGGYFLQLYSGGAIALSFSTAQDATFVGAVTFPLAKKITVTEGSNGLAGQSVLVAGTKAITITGITTNSRAFVQLVSQAGTTTTTVNLIAVCTTNTLTVSAVTTAGTNTINTTDTSTFNYFIIN